MISTKYRPFAVLYMAKIKTTQIPIYVGTFNNVDENANIDMIISLEPLLKEIGYARGGARYGVWKENEIPLRPFSSQPMGYNITGVDLFTIFEYLYQYEKISTYDKRLSLIDVIHKIKKTLNSNLFKPVHNMSNNTMPIDIYIEEIEFRFEMLLIDMMDKYKNKKKKTDIENKHIKKVIKILKKRVKKLDSEHVYEALESWKSKLIGNKNELKRQKRIIDAIQN